MILIYDFTDASQSIPPQRPPSSSSRFAIPNHSEQTPSCITYPITPSTGISHLNERIPPRIPPRIQRTPRTVQSIEQEVPIVPRETKSHSIIQNRRPPPPPPLPSNSVLPIIHTAESSKSHKTRSSRKLSRSYSIVDTQQRASSAIGSRTVPTTTTTTTTATKRVTLKEENLLKRSTSADRVGRERWLHHITDSVAVNNGKTCHLKTAKPHVFLIAIKLRTSLPNPLQLVTNHFNAMSKLLNATKYAIEHRDEDSVQLFQVGFYFLQRKND